MQCKSYWKTQGFAPKADFVDGLPDDVDTLIVGAGAAGLYTSIELSKYRLNSYVIDSAVPGTRSSAKGDGMLFIGSTEIPEGDIATFYRLLSLSIANKKLFDSLNAIFTNKKWCEYSQMGGIRMASTIIEAEALKKIVKIYRHFDIEATWLSMDSFRKIAGVRYSDGAIYVPGEALFNPLCFINGLINVSRAMKNEIISGITFESIEELPNGKVLAIDIDGNVVQANNVVLCLNAFSQHTSIPFLKKHIQPIRTQYIASPKINKEDISAIPPYPFSLDNGGNFFRTHNDRVIFGGGTKTTNSPSKEMGIMADAKVDECSAKDAAGTMSYYLDFIQPKDVTPEYIWTRNVAITKDRLPLVGKLPGYNHVYVNSGYDSHGISYLLIAGKIIADMIAEGKTKVYSAELFEPSRFN